MTRRLLILPVVLVVFVLGPVLIDAVLRWLTGTVGLSREAAFLTLVVALVLGASIAAEGALPPDDYLPPPPPVERD